MKVILFQIHPGKVRNWSVHPDLGLAYLKKSLKASGHEAEILDGELEPFDAAGVLQKIGGDGPRLLGIKLHTHQIPAVRSFLSEIKRSDPNVVTVIGGPHPSSVGNRIFESVPEADYSMVSEGEIGLPRLADSLENQSRETDWPSRVPGLVYRFEGGVKGTPTAFIDDLDSLGEPPWNEIGLPRYLNYRAPIRNAPFMPILTSRGCPLRCSFCAGFLVSPKKMRYRTPSLVVDEMEHLDRDFGVRTFAIQDESFTANIRHVEAFCDELIRRNRGYRWDCLNQGVRPASMTPELLSRMEKSGCFAVCLAVESANQSVLDDMNKKTTLEEISRAIRLVKTHTRMALSCNFILGYPTEDRRSCVNTIRFARRSGADYANFLIFTPLPGTPITEKLLSEGRLKIDSPEGIHYDVPNIPLKDLSLRGLKWMQIRAYLSFYLRPRVFSRVLRDAAGSGQIFDIIGRLRSVVFTGRSGRKSTCALTSADSSNAVRPLSGRTP